jgi:CheY-like chemotaxis protein
MSIALKLIKERTPGDYPKKSWAQEKQTFLPENKPAPEGIHQALLGETPRGILVVDDNPVVLKAFEMKLKAEGFAVTTTPNAASVAGMAATAKVDVIILDISFPAEGQMEWSGFTIMQWLKRFPELGDIPVIMITGSDSVQYREEALAAGAVAFFQKPVRYSDLLAVILQALGSRPGKV